MFKKLSLFLVGLALTGASFAEQTGPQTLIPVSGVIENKSSVPMFLSKPLGSFAWEVNGQPASVLNPGDKTAFSAMVKYIPTNTYVNPIVQLIYRGKTGSGKNACAIIVGVNPTDKSKFTGSIDCMDSVNVIGYTTSPCNGSDGRTCRVEIVDLK